MSEWKNRPTVPNYHPFKELYDQLLDMDKDELIDEIEKMIQDRNLAIKLESEGKSDMNTFVGKRMFENAIETYYWKFINKDTRVEESK